MVKSLVNFKSNEVEQKQPHLDRELVVLRASRGCETTST